MDLAVVTKDVPPFALVVGNPATIVGMVEQKIIEHNKNEMLIVGEGILSHIVLEALNLDIL